VSHESLHLVLGSVEGGAAEELDNFASLSAISGSLEDIPKCARYPNGLIGFD